jgi:Outer membrane efflux protein
MLDFEKARKKEQDTRTKTIAKVQQSYLAAKQAEEGYVQAMKARDAVQVQVQAAEKKQRFGYLTEAELQQQRDLLDQSEGAVLTAYIAYKAALSKLNFDSSGGLTYQNGILPYDKVSNGYEPFDPQPVVADANIGTWKIEPAVDSMTSTFSIQLDSKLRATHYQLRSKTAKQPIGNPIPVDQKVLHLSMVFSDLSDLELVVYKDKTEIVTADLDGYAPSGTLRRRAL